MYSRYHLRQLHHHHRHQRIFQDRYLLQNLFRQHLCLNLTHWHHY
jgi:hypothetical protein